LSKQIKLCQSFNQKIRVFFNATELQFLTEKKRAPQIPGNKVKEYTVCLDYSIYPPKIIISDHTIILIKHGKRLATASRIMLSA